VVTNSDLSSQRISELLKELGEDEEVRLKFLKACANPTFGICA